MSCKHSTPPPPPQRVCPERPSKANLPISFCCFSWTTFCFLFVCFKGQSFVKRKLKIPPAHPFPSLPPSNPTYFFFFFLLLLEKKNNPNKNPLITHNPTLQTANLDSSAEEQTWGREGNRSAKDPGVCRYTFQRLVVPPIPKPRERGSFLKVCSGGGGMSKHFTKRFVAHSLSVGQSWNHRRISVPTGSGLGGWKPLFPTSPPSP